MMRFIVAALLLCGCEGDGESEPALDAAALVVPDACMRETTGGCCDLMPDEDAARECSYEGQPSGACGVIVCWQADCSRTLLNFCVP